MKLFQKLILNLCLIMTPLMAQEKVKIQIHHPPEVSLYPELKGFSDSEMSQASSPGEPLTLSFPAPKANSIQNITIPIIITENTANSTTSSIEELQIVSYSNYFTAKIKTHTPYASFRLLISGPARVSHDGHLTLITLKQNPLG